MALTTVPPVKMPLWDTAGVKGRGLVSTVVWLRGEHDAATAGSLMATLERAMEAGDQNLVVDMSGVEFMSAATVGVLLRARELLGTRSRSLTLRASSSCVRRVLDACESPIPVFTTSPR